MKYKTILFILLTAVVIAAGSGSPRLSPWDAWRMAYTSFEKGEEQRDKGEYTKARESFNKALEYYNMVREARPDWNQKVISERIADCEKESRRMTAFLGPAASKSSEKNAQEQTSAADTSKELKLRKELSETKAELEELRRKNETRKNYESEISNLLRDQRILNERYSLLEKRYRAQEAKLAEPDQKLQKLEEQLVAMRLQLDLARKETAAAKQQGASDAAERNALKKARENAENARRQLNAELTALRRQATEKDQEIAAFKRHGVNAEKKEKELRLQLERSRNNVAALTTELNTLQSKYREKLTSSGAGEAANKKLGEENKRLQETVTALRKSGETAALRNNALQSRTESLRLQLADEIKKHAATTVALREFTQKNTSLTKELEREKANAAIINRELVSVRRRADDNASDLKKLNAENNELKRRLKFRDSEDFKNLTAARTERKKLRDELLKAEQAAAALKAELKINIDKYNALDRSNRELQSENRKLHAERISYQDQLKNLTGVSANSKELLRRYTELQKNFTALQAENRQNKLAADAAKPREAELARIKLRLAELDGLKQQLRREQSFNEQLNALRNRLERELKQLRPAGEENARLKSQLSDHQMLKNEVARLRKLNKELAEAKKLESRVADLQMQLAKLRPEAAEAGRLRRQNQELAQGKVLWENEITKMKLRLAAMVQLENEIKKLRQDLAKRSSALQASENKVTLLTAENRTLSTSVNDLETLRTKSRRLVEDQAKTLQDLRKAQLELTRQQKIISSAAKERLRLEKTIDDLKTHAGRNTGELEKKQTRIADLNKKISELEKSLARALKGKTAPAQTAQKDSPTAPSSSASFAADSRRIAELQNKLRAELTKSAENFRAREQAERNSARLLRQLQSEQKRLSEIQKEIELLKSVNSKNVNLEQELAGARILNTRMRSELEQLRPLRSELKRIGGELKKRSDELALAKKQNEQLLLSASEGRRIAAENRNIVKLNSDLANRSLKAESELASLKSELANYNRLRAEAEQLRKLTSELAVAKSLEAELAQAKLHITRLEQMRDELTRQRKLNDELTRKTLELEKELAARPMPAFAPVDYTPAASVKPVGKAEDYISAGRIAAADDKNELAIWNYRTALRLAPENTEAAERLGKLLALRGDYAEAAPLLSKARNAKPASIDLALETAYAYISLKRYGNAEAVIEPLLKRNRENPHLQIAAALIASGNGQYARASGLLLLAAARLPEDPQPKLELARLICNTDSRRIFEAVKLYEEARRLGAPPDLELEPKLSPMLNKRRNMTNFLTSAAAEAARNKDWHSVIWYYRQLIDLDREPEKYRPRLAFAQYKKGSSGAALETLSMGKNTPLGLLVKAFIHQQRKESRESRQAAAQARKMNHDRLIELPADWTEFIPEFRQYGKELTSHVK